MRRILLIAIVFVLNINVNAEQSTIGIYHNYYFSNIMNFNVRLDYPIKYFTVGMDLKYLLNTEEELPFQYYSGALFEKFGRKPFRAGIGMGISYGFNSLVKFSSYFFYGNIALNDFLQYVPLGINVDFEYFAGSMNVYPDVYLEFGFSRVLSVKMGMANLLIIDFGDNVFYRSGIFWGMKYAF